MTPFEKKVSGFCSSENLFENCNGVVLAVSGGPDSMALLRFFSKNREHFGFPLLCATVDHSIRAESADELKAVREYCEREGIAFEGLCVNIPETCPQDVSTETYSREVRYSFFNSLREKYGYSHIATAHTSDDNAETVLMNIIRGTSVSGLCGIPALRDDLVARPFLCCTKSELVAYCLSENITYFIDRTNSENIYRRNVVRNVIIPLLEKENPSVKRALNRLAAAAKTDDGFLSEKADEVLSEVVFSEKRAEIPFSAFENNPKAVMTRVIRAVFSRLAKTELSYEMTDGVYSLYLSGRTSDRLCVFGFEVRRNYSSLDIFVPEKNTVEVLQINAKVNTEIPFFDGIVKIIKRPEGTKKNRNCVSLRDTDGLIFRNRKAGDRFENTRDGSKALRRMYIDKKVPVALRDRLPLLEKDGKTVWAAGVGAAFPYRAEPTGDFYEIIYKEQEGKNYEQN